MLAPRSHPTQTTASTKTLNSHYCKKKLSAMRYRRIISQFSKTATKKHRNAPTVLHPGDKSAD